jgi:hypothetical protein
MNNSSLSVGTNSLTWSLFFSRRVQRAAYGLILLASTLSCSENSVTGLVPGTPALTVIAGNGQTGSAGDSLPVELQVQFKRCQGGTCAGVNGENINFVVTTGGGSLFVGTVRTAQFCPGGVNCKNGMAFNRWTLGPSAGTQTVEARTSYTNQDSLLVVGNFTATAKALPPTLMQKAAGDGQSAVVNTSVAIPPRVQVTDKFGNPIAGDTVIFVQTVGNGTITFASPNPVTDAKGFAGLGDWKLGRVAGLNQVTATLQINGGVAATFTATGTTAVAATLGAASPIQFPPSRIRTVIAPIARVSDSQGNGVQGVAVTFTVGMGGGSLDGVPSLTAITDANGNARVHWTLGSVSGKNTLQGTAQGLAGSPITFSDSTLCDCLYVANNNDNSIRVYATASNGNISPTTTIAGSNTMLDAPGRVAHDGAGRLYVANNTSITVYAPDAAGNAAPIAMISGPSTDMIAPSGIAFDSSGKIYVINASNTSDPRIDIYPASANGNVAPMASIRGGNTGLARPVDIAIDASGTLYVANLAAYTSGWSITVYSAGANGNAAPTATIAGNNTLLVAPIGIAVAGGKIYVTNWGHTDGGPSNVDTRLTVYTTTANGDVPPVETINGQGTMSEPAGITVDAAGSMYVTNYGNSYQGAIGWSVTVFAAGATGNAAPIRTIAGGNTGLNGPWGVTF